MDDSFDTSYEDPYMRHRYDPEPDPYRYDANHGDHSSGQYDRPEYGYDTSEPGERRQESDGHVYRYRSEELSQHQQPGQDPDFFHTYDAQNHTYNAPHHEFDPDHDLYLNRPDEQEIRPETHQGIGPAGGPPVAGWIPDPRRVNPIGAVAQSYQVVPAPPPDSRKLLVRWLILSSCVVLIMLLSAGGLRLWSYFNRSTPSRTLDEFCAALQKEDYAGAYSNFTKNMQAGFPEGNFAGMLAQDKVTACSHGDADDVASPAITSLRLMHASQQVNNDVVTLMKDKEDIWRISDVRRASSA